MMKKMMVVTDFDTTLKGIHMADELAGLLDRENQEVYRICLAKEDNYSDCLKVFYDLQPDKVITFDMAGFRLLCEKDDEVIYNRLYAQNYHILTKEAECYLDHLLRRMVFPSAVYTINQNEQNYIHTYYEQIFKVQDGSGFLGGFSARDYEESDDIRKRISDLPVVWKEIAEITQKKWKKNTKQAFDKIVKTEIDGRKIPYTDSEFVEVMGLLYDVVRLEEAKRFEEDYGKDKEKWSEIRNRYEISKLLEEVMKDIL